MSDIAKHTLVGIQIAGSEIANIVQDSAKLSPGLQKLVEDAGAIHPSAVMTLSAEPVLEFKTNKIDLLDAPASIADNDVVLWFRAYDAASGLGTGYVSLTIGDGLLEPMSLSGAPGQKAELTIRVHAISSDGDTVPVAVGTANPSSLSVLSVFYTLGTVTVGSGLSGVTSFEMQFGYNVTKNTGEGGYPYPTQAYIDGQRAQFSIGLRQIAAATSARLNTGNAETTLTAQFRRLAEGGVPNGTYTVTAVEGLASIDDVSGGRPAELTMTVDLAGNDWAGTNYLQFATVAPS